ncbi:MAG TPA: DUF2834 domain-containing protein [Polyangiaceae bacterium]
MTPDDKRLIGLYLGIAVLALIGTWSQNLAFYRETGSFSGLSFIEACFANHAAASISIDILFFGLAAFIFMGIEAKRLNMRWFWLYVLLSFLIAVSVTFPVFMAVRQRHLARAR